MIVFLIWIRNTEKFNKESWTPLVLAFFWGAVIATGLSLVVERFFSEYITSFLLLSVVIAPFVEELAKPLGLVFLRKNIDEMEDGLIFGIIAGLGFAATENFVYGVRFWDEGIIVLLSLFYIRTVASSLLHASATSLTGYGFAQKWLRKKSIFTFVPYVLLAVGIHALFNLFAYSAVTFHQIIGVVISAVFAVTLFWYIRKKIIFFDLLVVKKSSPTED
jgi:RsiW-degrading membrane proteinase PrsW (M82 family)